MKKETSAQKGKKGRNANKGNNPKAGQKGRNGLAAIVEHKPHNSNMRKNVNKVNNTHNSNKRQNANNGNLVQIIESINTDQNGDLLKIFTGMAQVTRCCRQDVAFCEGVTFHQFLILDAVAKAKGIYMADLHKLLSVEKSTTTRLVEPLVKKGLVRREKADFDSRAVRLTLTAAGKTTHKNVMTCLTDFLNRVMGNIKADKRKDVLDSVRIFIEAIKSAAVGCNCQ